MIKLGLMHAYNKERELSPCAYAITLPDLGRESQKGASIHVHLMIKNNQTAFIST
jgi:hypothetical protein